MKFTFTIFILFLLSRSNFVVAQIYGCTDDQATNFNSGATTNDGSCVYGSVSIGPLSSVNLPVNLRETSGLIAWNNSLWSHNDNSDTNLYSIDTVSGNIVQTYPLNGVVNVDWEEISQDQDYVYVGDFGNNTNGNRTDLKILRIEKNSLLLSVPIIDTINFSYSDQTDFTPTGGNNTDFDCESMIVSSDSIFLFTKQWVNLQTSVYSLPKLPGTYIAQYKNRLNVQGLITGATYIESKRLVALSAYTNLLQPFVYLLYDFNGTDFFGGNKRSIGISLPFHQVEGIATLDGLKYYCTNEFFSQPPVINNPQKLHVFDLSTYLSSYMQQLILSDHFNSRSLGVVKIYSNPIYDQLQFEVSTNYLNKSFFISDLYGKILMKGLMTSTKRILNISALNAGFYFLKVADLKEEKFIVVK